MPKCFDTSRDSYLNPKGSRRQREIEQEKAETRAESDSFADDQPRTLLGFLWRSVTGQN